MACTSLSASWRSGVVDAPGVIGSIRPLILLPVAVLTNLAPAQIEMILAHELAHIRRRDYAVNLFQTVAEAILFYHPCVWWVSARIREEREHCCDDVAVEVWGEPTAYAAALAELASWRARESALAVGATDGPLLARVRRLLRVQENDAPRPVSGLAVLAVGTLLAAGVVLQSSSTPPPPANTQAATAVVQPAGDWRIRKTDHFEIYYQPDMDLHAERVAQEAERAYERVSSELKHNLAFTVPIILFRTASELEQSAQAGPLVRSLVASFSEPSRDRIVLAMDRPSDQWYGLITHELAHVFGFDIVPGTATPLWITEGLAEYSEGDLGSERSGGPSRIGSRQRDSENQWASGRRRQHGSAVGICSRARGVRLHRITMGEVRRATVHLQDSPEPPATVRIRTKRRCRSDEMSSIRRSSDT